MLCGGVMVMVVSAVQCLYIIVVVGLEWYCTSSTIITTPSHAPSSPLATGLKSLHNSFLPTNTSQTALAY